MIFILALTDLARALAASRRTIRRLHGVKS